MKNFYIYEGPVYMFDRCVSTRWTAKTIAVSKKKAINNIKYQYASLNNLIPKVKISLPGNIKEFESEK